MSVPHRRQPPVPFAGRPIEKHQEAVTALLRTRGRSAPPQALPVAQALGRILHADIVAPAALPGFDNSQMDGFAVAAADTPGTLTVVETIAAGHDPVPLQPGCAAAIMTGAPVPAGADAVVAVERTGEGSFDVARVTVPEVPAGQFVRAAGSDVRAGEIVLAAGTRLTAPGLGALAALGLTEVTVTATPRAVICTGGDEVVEPGARLGPGQVHDANGTILAAWLRGRGVEVAAIRLIDDAADAFAGRLRADLQELQPDLVVTSGGISAGRFEVVKQTLQALPEAHVAFGSLAMQPGGPQGLGTIGPPDSPAAAAPTAEAPTAVVCLPGNPVSTWVSCEMLLAPALAAAWNLGPAPAWQPAALDAEVTPLTDKDQIRRGTLSASDDDSGLLAAPFSGTSSHLITAAARAGALIRIPAGQVALPAGSTVEIRVL